MNTKNLFLMAALLLQMTFASAMSLHPCTPTNKSTYPSYLSCQDPKNNYSIEIEVWVSPVTSYCPIENQLVIQRAKINVSPRDGSESYFLTAQPGDFSYQLSGPAGEGFFFSQKFDLNLKNCVSPLPGGISIGN